MSDEFKKCPNGHVYNSEYEQCPYCNGLDIDDDLGRLPPGTKIFPPEEAMCYDIGARSIDDKFI